MTTFQGNPEAADTDNRLVRGRVAVEWSELGEGLHGDYDPDDPDDVELLRFDFWIWSEEEDCWVGPEDTSYCTAFPVQTPVRWKRAGLEAMMDEAGEDVLSGNARRTCERLSWIGPATPGVVERVVDGQVEDEVRRRILELRDAGTWGPRAMLGAVAALVHEQRGALRFDDFPSVVRDSDAGLLNLLEIDERLLRGAPSERLLSHPDPRVRALGVRWLHGREGGDAGTREARRGGRLR